MKSLYEKWCDEAKEKKKIPQYSNVAGCGVTWPPLPSTDDVINKPVRPMDEHEKERI